MALQRAQAVLEAGPEAAAGWSADSGAGRGGGGDDLVVWQARAEAAEAAVAALGAQLREAQGALRVAATEFGEVIASSAALEEQNELLQAILAEKAAQLQRLEQLAAGAAAEAAALRRPGGGEGANPGLLL